MVFMSFCWFDLFNQYIIALCLLSQCFDLKSVWSDIGVATPVFSWLLGMEYLFPPLHFHFHFVSLCLKWITCKQDGVVSVFKTDSGSLCLLGEFNLLTFKVVQFSQFSSVAQSCPTLCDPMNRSTPGLPLHHQLPEFTQTHFHRVRDAIQPSHPRSSPSPPASNPSQHQGLFQWVNTSH